MIACDLNPLAKTPGTKSKVVSRALGTKTSLGDNTTSESTANAIRTWQHWGQTIQPSM